jgi:hypothetical protein
VGKTTLLITDVTRMSGEQVCVAALDEAGHSIRPLPEVGGKVFNHLRSDLRLPDGTVIRSRGVLSAAIKPLSRLRRPHLEDVAYQRAGASITGILPHEEFLTRLERCCDRGVREVYGRNLEGEPRAYTLPDRGSRSLGTVRAVVPAFVSLAEREGRLKPRLTFRTTAEDMTWDFPIVDLAFCGYVEARRSSNALAVIEMELNRKWCECAAIYLRVGLTRPYKPPGADWPEERCFVQVIAIHTQPDYLAGRCWADF